MKTGIIDVGGGYRGIYACGVLDYCLDKNIKFDLGIGVSAGSANMASFISGQRGRNYTFYTEYSSRKQYASLSNFIRKKSYIDMDYVYSVLSNSDGENPIDYTSLTNNPMEFLVVATQAITGEAKYFDKSDIKQDYYDIFKASSSIPFVCKPYFIEGTPYFDGALGDPVPIEKAFDLGCDRVIVMLTKPKNFIRNSKQDRKIAALIRKKYPIAAEKLCRRAQKYNESVAKAKEYEKQGIALIVAPDDICGVSTLTRDKELLQQLYKKGYADGVKIENFLRTNT